MITTARTLTAAAAVAVLGAGALAAGPVSASADDHQDPQQRVGTARAGGVVACNGGAALGLQSRLSAEPFSFNGTSNNDVAVPGAQVTVKGPKRGTDTFLITFSAETYYTGSGWMSLEAHKDGTPVAPFANNGSPFAFASETAYQSNSAQFCTKVGRGTHTLTIQASTTGDATESGWLDDWTMSVQRFN